MAKSYAQLQAKQRFDDLMEFLDEEFQKLPDPRTGNATRYELADVLKAAFAMFSLKSPSLLDFKQQTDPERSNLRTIYRIRGEIPCDDQMRGILDQFDPAHLRPLFAACFKRLEETSVVDEYRYWQRHVIVAVDGVEHFYSTKVSCPGCTTRQHRNGVTSYHHAGLAAILLDPQQREVFPLDFEPILKRDGAEKNDCERNAARRLCEQLQKRYPRLRMILVEDALYANAPHIRQITGYGWRYVLNVKPELHGSLERQFAGRRASGQVKELRIGDGEGGEDYFAWVSHLDLCESANDVKVNYLLYEQTDRKGKVSKWTWVTNLPLRASTVERVMRAGRSRWKIENETFNTLKNQGYHFEHNYGHGERHLATVLAVMMLLSFLIDRIQQLSCGLFGQLWKRPGTKAKVWAGMRSLFTVMEFESMEALYRRMATLYRLQIE
jgi:Transposase DDE domain/DDE_Tnp_1-associated